MTEEQIERTVAYRIDLIDEEYMSPGNTWSEQEYKAKIKVVDDWAEWQYQKLTS
jgi:hypothetical protein